MSRFTSAHHVNRPSAQQLVDRAAPANLNTASPQTNDLGLPANLPGNYNPFGNSNDLSFSGLPSLAALSETPTRMQSRTTTSVLGYNQSSREHSRHRASRWLVLVLPPAFVAQSQRIFSNTLSLGPSSRLSQGLLMPLYPTMYAQLGAIAREFNFPSIVGISLYMRVNEAGTPFTPRISEESWGILWGHLFEPNAPGPSGGLPISGRIEFDIDVAKARWYDTWISASRRETASSGSLSPTHVASIHQRQESKTTANFEDLQEQNQAIVSTGNGGSYTPKRLSLVERFDPNNSSPRMPLPTAEQVPVPMPEPHPAPPLVKNPILSPIPQEEEPPLSHREGIDNLVESWRASATFKTTLLASTGQVSLDPANMPNTLSLNDPVDEVDEVRSEINPEDYSWSVTSLGPPSVLDSPTSISSYRLPSVHMDRRAIGSVPLTPETCTSWGPDDCDPLSPVSSEFRLPSPDLGQRNLEYCPMTPVTATSWGPPSEYPPSPDPESQWIYYYRTPSLDLGQRAGWSRPVTPSTATSWGPPSEYPPSPPPEPQWAYYRAPSVDLGRRAEGSRPVTPSTATSWGPPEEWPPTPTTLSRVTTPDAAQQSFSFVEEIGGLAPQRTVMTPELSAPWSFVWPWLTLGDGNSKPRDSGSCRCLTQTASSSSLPESRKHLTTVECAPYPVINIYPAVYPHFDIYPSVQGDCVVRSHASTKFPSTSVVQTQERTLPAFSSVSNTGSSLNAGGIGYPTLNIYPAVYPYIEIYPRIQTVQSRAEVKPGDDGREFKSYLPSGPKVLETQPWAFGWPSFRPDPPPPVVPDSTRTLAQKSVMAYLVIEIYPAVYPFSDMYPTLGRHTSAQPPKPAPPPMSLVASEKSMGTKLGYPAITIYDAVYPHFDIYPRVARYVPKMTISVRLPGAYPVLDIYPAVYPHLNIYPAVTGVSMPVHSTPIPSASNSIKAADVHLTVDYPSLVIYPPVYPWIDVYPPIAGGITRTPSQASTRQPRTRPTRTKLRKRFTADEDAPPVPKLPDYVTLQTLSQAPSSPPKHDLASSLQGPFAYPVISIYPPVYPYIDIYPAVTGRSSAQPPRERRSTATPGKLHVSIKIGAEYPQFDIYPAVYPNFDIYPTIRGAAVKTRIPVPLTTLTAGVVDTSGPSYPVIEIYKQVYPYFDVYPSWSGTRDHPRHEHDTGAHYRPSLGFAVGGPEGAPLGSVGESRPLYPVIRIYDPVYPHFDIYPSWAYVQVVPATKQVSNTRKSHRELQEEVFSTSSILSRGTAPQPRGVPVLSFPLYPTYPALEIYKAAYPHFDLYPPCLQTLALPSNEVPLPEQGRRSYEELPTDVVLRTIQDDQGGPTTTDTEPHGLTMISKQSELVEEPAPFSPVPAVSPLRLRRRIPSSGQSSERNSSPSGPCMSSVSDNLPSIETMLSQSEDEMTKPLDVALTRSQSLPVRPTTPKRRQSALIAQRIKELNATVEPLEPSSDRPVRRSTKSLPISPTRA